VPTVVELSSFAGWHPTVITVSEARNRWITNPLESSKPQVADTPSALNTGAQMPAAANLEAANLEAQNLEAAKSSRKNSSVKSSLQTRSLTIEFETAALNECDLDFQAGRVTAIMGPNGSGKTSLLWACIGELDKNARVRGSVTPDFKSMRPELRLNQIALVPQRAADLLFLNTVSDELEESDRLSGLPAGTTAEVLRQIAGRIDPRRHPRDLSAGQQLALVISLQLAKNAPILLLDEPTRGLDYVAKRALAAQLTSLKNAGKTVIVASHDIEFVAALADRVVVLAEGRATHDDTAEAVLGAPGVLQSSVAAVVGGDSAPINLMQLEARYAGAR